MDTYTRTDVGSMIGSALWFGKWLAVAWLVICLGIPLVVYDWWLILFVALAVIGYKVVRARR